MQTRTQENRVIGNQKGVALVSGLLVVLVLSILGLGAMMSSSTELKISANDRSAKEVFYAAEAGIEDARSRLQAGSSPSPILDTQPANPDWTVFIGTPEKAQSVGYQETNSDYDFYEPLPSSLGYTVTITHKLDPSRAILKWGDNNGDGIPEENTLIGKPIYVITSEGYTDTGASKSIRIEASPVPELTIPAALYTKSTTTIQGTSTLVNGLDPCGTSSLPGILSRATVTQTGNPVIDGVPPTIENSSVNIDIQGLINQYKSTPTRSYNVNSATLTGMNWGTPAPGNTPETATSCDERNVVYFNTNSTYVKLSGGSSGCGLLLVEGDLLVNGGFQWYGVVLVTGSIAFIGGGEKNVTGAMLAGEAVSADLVGGDASIVYCSEAVRRQTAYRPLIVHRWAELFS
jgi:hypothetical protein